MGKALPGELSCPCDRSCFHYVVETIWHVVDLLPYMHDVQADTFINEILHYSCNNLKFYIIVAITYPFFHEFYVDFLLICLIPLYWTQDVSSEHDFLILSN